jgi:hypothetical protein
MEGLTAASIVDSTIGAGLLDLLEQAAMLGRVPDEYATPLPSSDPASVAQGADWAAELSFGELVKLAVIAHNLTGSYWDHDRGIPTLRLRKEREPIAEAIAARPDSSLWFASVADEQWWWTDGSGVPPGVLGSDLDELSWVWSTRPAHALLTTSPLPDEMMATGVDAPVDFVWDICFGPRARWRFEVAPDARVYQVDGPADWETLVRRYPHDASGAYVNGREISSINDRNDRAGLAEVLAIEDQRAVRRGWRRFLNPDWAAVAHEWDGVHLSWVGYLLTDGTAIDLDGGDVTMLRNWGSERTVWLAPVLRNPTPLPLPAAAHDEARSPDTPDWDQELDALRRFACAVGPPE